MSKKKTTKKTVKKNNPLKNKKVWIGAVCVVGLILIGGAGLLLWSKNHTVNEKLDYDPTKYITIGDYKGIQVSLEVTDEDVQDEVDSILEDHASYQELTGTTQTGQTIRASFEGYVDGTKKEDTCGEDYVELGSGEWLDGFEENLTGVNTGDSVVFTVPVPEGTYDDPSIDGKEVEFHATVLYICGEEVLPEYSDDFVKSISKKYKTTAEYNAYLKKKLHKENMRGLTC